MHVIRLRKPWEKTTHPDGHVVRIDVPEGPVEEGPVEEMQSVEMIAHYGRSFHRPSGLGESIVYLNISAWHGQLVSMSLNAKPIPHVEGESQIRVEVQSLLKSHNRLRISLSGSVETPPRLSGEVTLEILD